MATGWAAPVVLMADWQLRRGETVNVRHLLVSLSEAGGRNLSSISAKNASEGSTHRLDKLVNAYALLPHPPPMLCRVGVLLLPQTLATPIVHPPYISHVHKMGPTEGHQRPGGHLNFCERFKQQINLVLQTRQRTFNRTCVD